jgi:hypothetical protein
MAFCFRFLIQKGSNFPWKMLRIWWRGTQFRQLLLHSPTKQSGWGRNAEKNCLEGVCDHQKVVQWREWSSRGLKGRSYENSLFKGLVA